jgi:hypothetical protein
MGRPPRHHRAPPRTAEVDGRRPRHRRDRPPLPRRLTAAEHKSKAGGSGSSTRGAAGHCRWIRVQCPRRRRPLQVDPGPVPEAPPATAGGSGSSTRGAAGHGRWIRVQCPRRRRPLRLWPLVPGSGTDQISGFSSGAVVGVKPSAVSRAEGSSSSLSPSPQDPSHLWTAIAGRDLRSR